MRHRTRWNNALWLAGFAIVCGLGMPLGIADGQARGQAACRPATPSPCAADGVCRPKRDTWGWYQTKWRSWPGEKVGMTPTEVEEIEAEDKIEKGLEGFELPTPEQEDLRGMQKKDTDSESDEAEPATDTLPGVGDQGSAAPLPLLLPAARNVAMRLKDSPQPLPTVNPSQPSATGPAGIPKGINVQDDEPPPLPASLKRIANRGRGLPSPILVPSAPVPMRVSSGNAPNTPINTSGRRVVPAGWQQPIGIRLINPAAALVPEATGDQLRQAIYYESSGQ